MNSWNEDDLRAIAESDDLYISPFREDGTTYGTPTLVWPLVVDGEVYVRGANGQQSSWYGYEYGHICCMTVIQLKAELNSSWRVVIPTPILLNHLAQPPAIRATCVLKEADPYGSFVCAEQHGKYSVVQE